MNKKLLLAGGGGHCKTVIEAVESVVEYNEIGIVDVIANIGKDVLGYQIIGSDTDLIDLKNKGYKNAFVSMGSIGNSNKRMELFLLLKELGFFIPSIIDRSANVSNYSSILEGVFVGKNVIINAGSEIGRGVILNTGCIIEHDCKIEDFVHVASGAVLSGNVTIGKNAHIGSNSVIRQNISIGEGSIIGIGSAIVKNIGDYCLAYGNPCREVNNK